jgi:hypothetical protein
MTILEHFFEHTGAQKNGHIMAIDISGVQK